MREIGHTKNFILGGLNGDAVTKETKQAVGRAGNGVKISLIYSILSLG